MRIFPALILTLFVLVALPVHAAPFITGVPSVIDGDTINIHGQRIRLHGIDAPESSQTCQKGDGSNYRCGQDAALALDDQIAHRLVTCEIRDKDRYGRFIGICSAGGDDLNAWMVEHGHAMAYRKYSTDYLTQEGDAQEAKAGIWQGTFVPPWTWRHAPHDTQ